MEGCRRQEFASIFASLSANVTYIFFQTNILMYIQYTHWHLRFHCCHSHQMPWPSWQASDWSLQPSLQDLAKFFCTCHCDKMGCEDRYEGFYVISHVGKVLANFSAAKTVLTLTCVSLLTAVLSTDCRETEWFVLLDADAWSWRQLDLLLQIPSSFCMHVKARMMIFE